MNEKDVEEIMHTPFKQLSEHCQDPKTLAAVIKVAYQQGINVGLQMAHEHYHTMFADYNEISITN